MTILSLTSPTQGCQMLQHWVGEIAIQGVPTYIRRTVCHKSHWVESVKTSSQCNGTFLTRVGLLAMM